MTITEDDFQFTLAQFLLRDELSENPTIHPRRIEMRKGTILTKIEKLVREYEDKNIEVDVEPYKETMRKLRKMSIPEYDELISIIEENYKITSKNIISDFFEQDTDFSDNQSIESEVQAEKLSTTSNLNSDNLNHDITISKNIFINLLRQKENDKNDK